MTTRITIVLLSACAALLLGCQFTAKDKGALYLEFGTRIALGTETSATQATATASADFTDWVQEPIVNRFINPEEPPEPEAEGGNE